MRRFTDGLVVVVSPAQRTESNRAVQSSQFAGTLQERIVRRQLAVASRCSSHDEARVRVWCVHLGAPGSRVLRARVCIVRLAFADMRVRSAGRMRLRH